MSPHIVRYLLERGADPEIMDVRYDLGINVDLWMLMEYIGG